MSGRIKRGDPRFERLALNYNPIRNPTLEVNYEILLS
jgi:hypothetical protein